MLRSNSLMCDGFDFKAGDNAEHPLAVILQSDRLKIKEANNHELVSCDTQHGTFFILF